MGHKLEVWERHSLVSTVPLHFDKEHYLIGDVFERGEVWMPSGFHCVCYWRLKEHSACICLPICMSHMHKQQEML